ncbi:MAG: alpha/beta fold hydrolase [Thermoleophilia bacterium]
MPGLHVHQFGPDDGPPLLLLHGVTSTGFRFRRFAEAELPGVRAIAPDLRGHGESTWDPPWHVERHVADVLALMDDLGLDRVPLAAHSFGGLIAMTLVGVAPERVERLALIDPATGLAPAAAASRAEETRRDEGWATIDEARAARLALRPPHSRDTVEEDLATFLRRDPDGRHRLHYSRSAVITGWSEMARPTPPLAGYPGHVLLVPALQADFVTPAMVERMRGELDGRLVAEGLDAGHVLYWDAPEGLGALMRAWLGR